MRRLLLGHTGVSWRNWLQEKRGDSELICLDPADPIQAPPGRLSRFSGTRAVETHFYGSLDPTAAPHALVAGLGKLLRQASSELIVQLPPYRPGPLLRQTVSLCAELTRPDEIWVAEGTEFSLNGFPIGPQSVTLEAAFPEMVQAAQRRARWLQFFERARIQEVDFGEIVVQGSRLGTGKAFSAADLADLRLPAVSYAERAGAGLLLVTSVQLSDSEVTQALNLSHAARLTGVTPEDYQNVVCSFSRQDGTDFAFGVIQSVDFSRRVMSVLSDAIPPAPIRILKLGQLRVDRSGNELRPARPWSI